MAEHPKKQQTGATQPASAQALAIEHASGPIQVLAGPGSGKTYLTIRRIRHLICHHGISPDKILVITFTKAAAKEMEDRFYKLTEGLYRGVSFGTFHAIYFHILKKSGYGGGKLTLATAQDKWNCLKHVLNMHDVKDVDKELLGMLLKEISRQKNRGISDIEYAAKNIGNEKLWHTDMRYIEDEKLQRLFPSIFKEYCELMQEANKLDFDDMIFLCDKLLVEHREIKDYWQRAFSHILVDEFQDISPLQYRVLKRLAAPEHNLFVVGDDDQSIYGFRGAGPNIMRQFMKDYAEAVQLTLDTNYRSAEHIVKASLFLICDNQNRFSKQMRADREESGSVVLCAFQEKEEEEQYVINRLKEMSPQEQEHTAVIYRTNAQLTVLSRLLVRENIPFSSKERMDNLFEHDIAKDFLAYMQYAHDIYEKQRDMTENQRNVMGKRRDFLRIMNKPCRYIQRCALDDGDCSERALYNFYIHKPYMQELLSRFFADLNRIAKLRPYLAIDYIRKTVGYDACLCENKGKDEREKLLEIADEIAQTASECRTLQEWMQYIALYSERLAKNLREKQREDKGVKLMTMHGAKGLEYDTVFLPQINAKLIPGRKAHTKEELEEERRIFYVAMTRARQRLEISYYKDPSPFLARLSAEPYVIKTSRQS